MPTVDPNTPAGNVTAQNVTATNMVTLPAQYKPYQTTTYTKAAIQTGGAAAWLTTSSPLTLFTVTGTVLCRVYGVVGATSFTSASDLGTLSVGVAGSTQLFIPTSAVSNAVGQFAVNSIWVGATPTLLGAVPLLANLTWVYVNGTPIIVTIATQSMSAGAVVMYCDWIPISSGATVV